MATRQPPQQQSPPVQRLRVRYAKRGRARFTSHRDFGRAFERALRRAGVPMAFSSGFTPHPRISYANAAPTGAASEAEYLEIGLSAACDPDRVRAALDAALPPGLDVVEVVPAPPGALADQLTGSQWQVDLPEVGVGVLDPAIAAFLALAEAPVQRMTKNGLRTFDARAAVVGLSAEPGRLLVTLEHVVPAVRPNDVLSALKALDARVGAGAAPVLTRLRQGRLDPASHQVEAP